jgi:hypothetical protein
MDRQGRRFAREYIWFAVALVAILLGSAARAAAAERTSPQAYYYYKRFGLLTEYVSESQDVSRTFGTGANTLTRRAPKAG